MHLLKDFISGAKKKKFHVELWQKAANNDESLNRNLLSESIRFHFDLYTMNLKNIHHLRIKISVCSLSTIPLFIFPVNYFASARSAPMQLLVSFTFWKLTHAHGGWIKRPIKISKDEGFMLLSKIRFPSKIQVFNKTKNDGKEGNKENSVFKYFGYS